MSLTDEINAISDKVYELEQENERLKQSLEDMREAKNQPNQLYEKLIILLEPDIQRTEKLIGNSPRIQEIIDTYHLIKEMNNDAMSKL